MKRKTKRHHRQPKCALTPSKRKISTPPRVPKDPSTSTKHDSIVILSSQSRTPPSQSSRGQNSGKEEGNPGADVDSSHLATPAEEPKESERLEGNLSGTKKPKPVSTVEGNLPETRQLKSTSTRERNSETRQLKSTSTGEGNSETRKLKSTSMGEGNSETRKQKSTSAAEGDRSETKKPKPASVVEGDLSEKSKPKPAPAAEETSSVSVRRKLQPALATEECLGEKRNRSPLLQQQTVSHTSLRTDITQNRSASHQMLRMREVPRQQRKASRQLSCQREV